MTKPPNVTKSKIKNLTRKSTRESINLYEEFCQRLKMSKNEHNFRTNLQTKNPVIYQDVYSLAALQRYIDKCPRWR